MPQYEDVYEPPLLDATFIDKIDDLIAELQNLSAPSATNVAVSPTGLHYITEDDAQGALAELDAECYSLSNSLTQLIYTKVFNESISVTANNSFGKNVDATVNGYTFLGSIGVMATSGAGNLYRLNATQYDTPNNLYISGYSTATATITVRVVALYVKTLS